MYHKQRNMDTMKCSPTLLPLLDTANKNVFHPAVSRNVHNEDYGDYAILQQDILPDILENTKDVATLDEHMVQTVNNMDTNN